MPNAPDCDLIIIGAGAAGLMAAIWAGRSFPDKRIAALDSAKRIGAKILVAGGGRCNVTHDQIDETAYAGSSRSAIKKVLRRFDVPQTLRFFHEIGVELKPTGKLFPITDDAQTVLDALTGAAAAAGAQIIHPRRVETIDRLDDGFRVCGVWGMLTARRVVLATGGRSLPKSGSDGHGYVLAQSLGHSLTPRIFPALVPLILPDGHPLRALSGLSADVEIAVVSASGKRLVSFAGSLLCTHFGISGPVVLDISRYYLDAHADDPQVRLVVNWLPGQTVDSFERMILDQPKAGALRLLSERLPDRLARTLLSIAGVEVGTTCGTLTRDQRRALVSTVCALHLPVAGDRGYTYAEVTAGGVPLSEIRLETMESRVCPGLYLCGEICAVDGRIGGYNFQWAWASGYVVGVSALRDSEGCL